MLQKNNLGEFSQIIKTIYLCHGKNLSLSPDGKSVRGIEPKTVKTVFIL